VTDRPTLTDFLLARIAEDEAVARAATPGLWACETAPNGFPAMVVGNNMTVADTYDKPHLSDANHIARHDPARVLAECEAKRRIVALHVGSGRDPFYSHKGGPLDTCDVCVSFHADMDCSNEPWPCPTLRILALPYADHADYDESWRP